MKRLKLYVMVGVPTETDDDIDELIDFGIRSGAPLEVIENLQEIEDEVEIYESIEDIWPDYPSKDDFFFNEDEY